MNAKHRFSYPTILLFFSICIDLGTIVKFKYASEIYREKNIICDFSDMRSDVVFDCRPEKKNLEIKNKIDNSGVR